MRGLRYRRALLALALLAACAKDKTTALDVKLQITGGAIDQVRIDAVTVGSVALPLQDEPTVMFPASPRMLKSGDVLTIWFADSADMMMVVVTATGLRCGMPATAQAMTIPKTLTKGQTVATTLALDATLPVTCPGDGGAGKGGGGGRGGGAGGAGGSAGGAGGAGGAAGIGGMGGSAGAAGSAGVAGVAGSAGGAAGRGGMGGVAGGGGVTAGVAGGGGVTAGVAGSSGRGGGGGTAGAAGRGGTTGSAGAGGAAGRGGTSGGGMTGTGGSAGRGGSGGGGTTGTGGMVCATAPLDTVAVASSALPSQQITSCGYPVIGTTVQYMWTPSDYFALASTATYGTNGANCGRCVELVYTLAPAPVTATVVGLCDPALCPNPNQPAFALGLGAFQQLAPSGQTQIPASGTTLKYRFVPCPVPTGGTGQPLPMQAAFAFNGGVGTAVVFYQQRYGILSGWYQLPGGSRIDMTLGTDAQWHPNNGNVFNASQATFHLTDVNNAMISFTTSIGTTGMAEPVNAQFPTCMLP